MTETQTPTQQAAAKLLQRAHRRCLPTLELGCETLIEVYDGWLILDPGSRRPLRFTTSAEAYYAHTVGDSDERPTVRIISRRDAAYRVALLVRGAA